MSHVEHNIASGGADAARALPQLRLADNGAVVSVLPSAPTGAGDERTAPLFNPFGLPQVPKSLTDHLALLGERFHARHGRCVAAVLLLDVASRQWSWAIPAQRCARDAACWSASRADFPAFPPTALLAGSFQTRVLAEGEQPADCPPPHDGLHFVLVAGQRGEPPAIWSFVRAAGRTRHVPAADLIVDDLDAAIAQALPRLTLT